MVINTQGATLAQEEIDEYVNYVQAKNPEQEIAVLNLNIIIVMIMN